MFFLKRGQVGLNVIRDLEKRELKELVGLLREIAGAERLENGK